MDRHSPTPTNSTWQLLWTGTALGLDPLVDGEPEPVIGLKLPQ